MRLGARTGLPRRELSTAGFAVVAYPVEYGNSGVMTFIVNHDGKIFQKNLGSNTASIAKGMQEYNPDKSWTEVKQ